MSDKKTESAESLQGKYPDYVYSGLDVRNQKEFDGKEKIYFDRIMDLLEENHPNWKQSDLLEEGFNEGYFAYDYNGGLVVTQLGKDEVSL